jgi:hypothetical protein
MVQTKLVLNEFALTDVEPLRNVCPLSKEASDLSRGTCMKYENCVTNEPFVKLIGRICETIESV